MYYTFFFNLCKAFVKTELNFELNSNYPYRLNNEPLEPFYTVEMISKVNTHSMLIAVNLNWFAVAFPTKAIAKYILNNENRE